MRPLIKIAVLALATISRADQPPTDIAYFRNDTGKPVLVYLSTRPGQYYAVFGLGNGGVDSMALTARTAATVTLVPKHERSWLSNAPEAKMVARSKLIIPARVHGGSTERHLFYRISNGQVRLE